MRNHKALTCFAAIASIVITLLNIQVVKADFEEGIEAYHLQNYAKAAQELWIIADEKLSPQAKQSDKDNQVVAQFIIGAMFMGNKGVTQDYSESYKWFLKAAEQGNVGAQVSLGILYGQGLGVAQDYEESYKWFLKSGGQGDMLSQFNLGMLYEHGQGISQNYEEAVKWYRLAADQGYSLSQFNLGVMYSKGKGMPQDYVEAARWYLLAADQGLAKAQKNLALFYATGRGVTQDFIQAHKWMNLAAAKSGTSNNIEVRDQIATEMTLVQIAEAQKLAREWKPKEGLTVSNQTDKP